MSRDGFGLDLEGLEDPYTTPVGVDGIKLGEELPRELYRLGRDVKVGNASVEDRALYEKSLSLAQPILKWGPPPPPTYKVPPTIHYILIDRDPNTIPATWIEARESCMGLHPDWEFKFWDRDSAVAFLEREHPWFVETWHGYKHPIQRADSLRYFVLWSFGGVYLDMDLACRRSLDPFRRFDFVAPEAHPVGVSNGFVMSRPQSPFLNRVLSALPYFNHVYISAYPTVMFSTGCTFLSAQLTIYPLPNRDELKVLGGQRNKLSGRVTTPLFRHLGASSWHEGDAGVYSALGAFLKKVPLFGKGGGSVSTPTTATRLPPTSASNNVLTDFPLWSLMSAGMVLACGVAFFVWVRRWRRKRCGLGPVGVVIGGGIIDKKDVV
ncbi:hypothetical protein HK104_010894 [Borealophlyctis nickersoniae]|nr:hypothetical protein HK104_010894 [Borealophlyctis nickersoniae]